MEKLWERENRYGKNLHCSFSSRLPFDVTDKARMNSSNSMEPSWTGREKEKRERRKQTHTHKYTHTGSQTERQRKQISADIRQLTFCGCGEKGELMGWEPRQTTPMSHKYYEERKKKLSRRRTQGIYDRPSDKWEATAGGARTLT